MGKKITPFVSVVIPVLNGERTIRECLVSLLRTDYPPERREILVVDNGSTDRTTEIVQAYPVTLLREERRGASAARNRGIEASRGEILALTDADCVVSRGWLQELVQGFENEEVGVVAGEIVAYPPETPAERYTAMRNPRWHLSTLSYPASPWFASANSALRREVFNLIGLFDVRLPGTGGCEDIDFAWRFLQSKRFKLIYRPKAVVFHRHRVTARGLFKQYRAYGYGQAMLRRKYPDRLAWDWRRELEAYKDLFLTALALGGAAIRSKLKVRNTADFSYQYSDLARKLGARIGFASGMFRNV
jgi:glycosyltransferase involved in cell wall biosynthesis